MKFTKSIAAVALTASSAFALIGPIGGTKSYCLNVYEASDGAKYAGTCDESRNNEILEKVLLENGCAEGQASLRAFETSPGKYDIEIAGCLPPGVVQL